MARASRKDYALALRALGWLVAARTALALLPLRRALGLFDVRKRPGGSLEPDAAAWAIQAVSRRLAGTHCLARSMALNAMLRRGGHASEIRFGVDREGDGAFAAHAWVTCSGHPVPDEDVGRFASFG